MRKTLCAAVMLFALSASAVAVADTVDITSSGAGGGGTPKKPVAVAPFFNLNFSGTGAARPATPSKVAFRWTGLKASGNHFPTCSAAQIQTAQSDSVCPHGSQMGSGTLEVLIGPDSSPDTKLACAKTVAIFNSGGTKAVLYAFGPGSACVGVAYLAPIPIAWTNSKTGTQLAGAIPANIVHPLPGISGAISQLSLKFRKATVKVHKQRLAYLAGIGCGKSKTRHFTFTAYASAYSHPLVTTITAGKC